MLVVQRLAGVLLQVQPLDPDVDETRPIVPGLFLSPLSGRSRR